MAQHRHTQPSALRRFLDGQSSAGLVLMGAAALALVIANSPLGSGYEALLHAYIGPLSLGHWINDGLMAVFFLLFGLEIKREVLDGQLSSGPKQPLKTINLAVLLEGVGASSRNGSSLPMKPAERESR